ncbi:Oidioi.mRNA.OKI2018_I69.chr2.g5126.t1.cds [Oikopleura dioica]|uniref:Oidioi.mRNA.OKI2018_I69.chr2.g5126.t1.cds n=1 Tax=Oikopleura dioica TaxID=34765 RepID=A0ABN7T8M0_OIKDI|nr:Oidioi.mRNA.OKI2018_I69.chr2.g5126.t1.cds [Oikopleura dioica]
MLGEKINEEEVAKMADFVPTTYRLFLDKLAKLRPSEFSFQKDQANDDGEKVCSERILFRPPTRGLTADQITVKWLRPPNPPISSTKNLPENEPKPVVVLQKNEKPSSFFPTIESRLPKFEKADQKIHDQQVGLAKVDDYNSNKRKEPSNGTKKVESLKKTRNTLELHRIERFDSSFDSHYGENVPRWISSVTIRKRTKTNS